MMHNLINLSNVFCETQKDNFVINYTSVDTKTKNLNFEIPKSISISQSTLSLSWIKDSKMFEFLENEIEEINDISSIIRSDKEYIIEHKK